MKKKILILCLMIIGGYVLIVFGSKSSIDNISNNDWQVDFVDNFEFFDVSNWQDQRIWVNNENQCYVPDGKYNTREVSNGTLKIKVINKVDILFIENQK
jgi:hypothetical protein